MLCVGGSPASLPPLRHAPLSRALAPSAPHGSAALAPLRPSAPASASPLAVLACINFRTMPHHILRIFFIQVSVLACINSAQFLSISPSFFYTSLLPAIPRASDAFFYQPHNPLFQPHDHLSLMGYNSKVYFVRLFLL